MNRAGTWDLLYTSRLPAEEEQSRQAEKLINRGEEAEIRIESEAQAGLSRWKNPRPGMIYARDVRLTNEEKNSILLFSYSGKERHERFRFDVNYAINMFRVWRYRYDDYLVWDFQYIELRRLNKRKCKIIESFQRLINTKAINCHEKSVKNFLSRKERRRSK